jgi:putative DNA methylase
MPNHVHVLLTSIEKYSLSKIIHSWKSFTAHQANKALNRTGEFWQTEYYDRYIRNDKHLSAAVEYIINNPVKAGLIGKAENWKWSGMKYSGFEVYFNGADE